MEAAVTRTKETNNEILSTVLPEGFLDYWGVFVNIGPPYALFALCQDASRYMDEFHTGGVIMTIRTWLSMQ